MKTLKSPLGRSVKQVRLLDLVCRITTKLQIFIYPDFYLFKGKINLSYFFLKADSTSELSDTHFLYRILDSKKTSHFQFSVPGLPEIHRNLKQQKNFNSHDGFFRKSAFCTFSSINPGFCGAWGML